MSFSTPQGSASYPPQGRASMLTKTFLCIPPLLYQSTPLSHPQTRRVETLCTPTRTRRSEILHLSRSQLGAGSAPWPKRRKGKSGAVGCRRLGCRELINRGVEPGSCHNQEVCRVSSLPLPVMWVELFWENTGRVHRNMLIASPLQGSEVELQSPVVPSD